MKNMMRGNISHLIILFLLLGLTGCQRDYMCLNKEVIGPSFIQNGECHGYAFKPVKNVKYLGSRLGTNGKMMITIGAGHGSLLSGTEITLNENRLAGVIEETWERSIERYEQQVASGTNKLIKVFNPHLGLPNYIRKHYDTNIRTLFSYNISANSDLSFYIICHFSERLPSLHDMKIGELSSFKCGVHFAYNPYIMVRVAVNYLELKNAKVKVDEIHKFISNLIIKEKNSG